MITRIYMGVLGTVFIVAIFAGSYQDIPLWVVWLGGIGAAALAGVLALTVLGRRILRGDFDPDHATRTDAATSEQADESTAPVPEQMPEQVPEQVPEQMPEQMPEQTPEHRVGEEEPERLDAPLDAQAHASKPDIHNNLSPSKANGLGGPDRTTE